MLSDQELAAILLRQRLASTSDCDDIIPAREFRADVRCGLARFTSMAGGTPTRTCCPIVHRRDGRIIGARSRRKACPPQSRLQRRTTCSCPHKQVWSEQHQMRSAYYQPTSPRPGTILSHGRNSAKKSASNIWVHWPHLNGRGTGAMTPQLLCDTLRLTLPALFDCAPAPRGGVKVSTPMLYRRSRVDVFVLERGQATTAAIWLRMQSVAELTVEEDSRANFGDLRPGHCARTWATRACCESGKSHAVHRVWQRCAWRIRITFTWQTFADRGRSLAA